MRCRNPQSTNNRFGCSCKWSACAAESTERCFHLRNRDGERGRCEWRCDNTNVGRKCTQCMWKLHLKCLMCSKATVEFARRRSARLQLTNSAHLFRASVARPTPIAFSKTCFPHNAHVHQFSEWTPAFFSFLPTAIWQYSTNERTNSKREKNKKKSKTEKAVLHRLSCSSHFTSIHLLDLLMGHKLKTE